MVIEGFFDYQNILELKNSLVCSGNFLPFDNGFIKENNFFNIYDSFFSILLGGTYSSGEDSIISNLTPNDRTQSSRLEDILFVSTSDKPKIGVWYDELSQTLQLSRDLFGLVPLFYVHIPNNFVAFSTDYNVLLKKKEVKKYLQINHRKILSYDSDSFTDQYCDVSETFFSPIKSVLPGHFLKISSDKVHTSVPFESLTPEKWAHLKDLESVASTLQGLLKKSIANTVNDNSKFVGSHLSGGLDSSSVSSLYKFMYQERPLHTFHIKANYPEADESSYALLVANHLHSLHHEVNQPDNDLELLKLGNLLYGQPGTSYISAASNLSSIAFAKESGCDILLSGHGGDSIIGSGMEVLDKAFEEKKWSLLLTLLKKRIPYFSYAGLYKNWLTYSDKKKHQLVVQHFLYTRISSFRGLPFKKLFKIYREISNGLGISESYFIKRASKSFFLRLLKKNTIVESSLIRKDFFHSVKKDIDKFNHPASLLNDLPVHYIELFEDVFNAHGIRGQEQYFALGKHYGISIRAPYLNKDVLELCMAVPDIIKFGDGKGREHLREAMKGILVEEVRSRSTKATLSSPDGEDMTLRLFNQSQYYLEPIRDVWQYIDREKFKKQVLILKNNQIPFIQKSKTYFHITRTISLSVWLEWVKENNILD